MCVSLFVTPQQSRDDEYLEQLIDQQRQAAAFRQQWVTEEVQREKALKRKNKDALIDDLVTALWSLLALPVLCPFLWFFVCINDDDDDSGGSGPNKL